MTDIYDKLLKQGLIKLKEIEFNDVPKEEEIEHDFSDKYLKSKEKLINKLSRSYWKYINTAAKKVAVIIISFIIAFSSLMTVDAFRETVINFIVTMYEAFGKVENNLWSDNHINSFYSVINAFSEHTKVASHCNESIYTQLWITKDKYLISLNQVPANTPNQFDSEHGELREIIVNDTPCLTCKTNADYFCYWEFDGYRFELIYPIDFGEEFMSEVVGHLVEVDPEELTTE